MRRVCLNHDDIYMHDDFKELLVRMVDERIDDLRRGCMLTIIGSDEYLIKLIHRINPEEKLKSFDIIVYSTIPGSVRIRKDTFTVKVVNVGERYLPDRTKVYILILPGACLPFKPYEFQTSLMNEDLIYGCNTRNSSKE